MAAAGFSSPSRSGRRQPARAFCAPLAILAESEAAQAGGGRAERPLYGHALAWPGRATGGRMFKMLRIALAVGAMAWFSPVRKGPDPALPEVRAAPFGAGALGKLGEPWDALPKPLRRQLADALLRRSFDPAAFRDTLTPGDREPPWRGR